MTISLPAGLVRELDIVRKRENRTYVEVIHEALSQYFKSQYPADEPSKTELAAVKRGRSAYARGEYSTLNDLIHELGSARHKARKNRIRKAS